MIFLLVFRSHPLEESECLDFKLGSRCLVIVSRFQMYRQPIYPRYIICHIITRNMVFNVLNLKSLIILGMQRPRRPRLFLAGGHYACGCGEWIFHSIHQADFSCTAAVANILTERFFSENIEQFYLETSNTGDCYQQRQHFFTFFLPHRGVLSTSFASVFVCNQETHTIGSSG